MVLTKKKKRALMVFFYIYMILGAIMVYLLFYSSGLQIIEKPTFDQPTKEIFFKNNSSRIIHNISISVLTEGGEKILLKKIPKALPLEENKIELESLKTFNAAILIAESPFHEPFSKIFVLSRTAKALNYRLKFPAIIFLNNSFSFELETCNELERVRKVGVKIVVEENFFDKEEETRTILLPPNECKSINYLLSPKQSGQTTIFFNIEVENNKDRLSKTIEVVE